MPDHIVTNASPMLQGTDGCPSVQECPYCGAALYTRGIQAGSKIIWMQIPDPCSCAAAQAAHQEILAQQQQLQQAQHEAARQEKLQKRVERLIKDSGINQRFLSRTFDTFIDRPETGTALRRCKSFADSFPPPGGKNGLVIAGPPGVGKTHLAAAIANELLGRGIPVVCMTMIDLLGRIKSTYDGGATEDDILSLYRQVPLLVIDDIGKEVATEWALAKIYAIVNARYEAMLPLIVTTNYEGKRLIRRLTPKDSGDSMTAEAILDRLREMCVGIIIRASSWRDRKQTGDMKYETDAAQSVYEIQPPIPGGILETGEQEEF